MRIVANALVDQRMLRGGQRIGLIWWALATAMLARVAAADTIGKFPSRCEYQGDGCVYRREAKIDPEHAPAANKVDHHLTPLQLFNWTGGRGTILSKTPRQGRENEWIELHGKVSAVIIEGDG